MGCYWLTKIKPGAKGEGKIFGSPEEALLAFEFGEVDLKAKIKVRGVKPETKEKREALGHQILVSGFLETSVGRIIFNEKLTSGFSFSKF